MDDDLRLVALLGIKSLVVPSLSPVSEIVVAVTPLTDEETSVKSIERTRKRTYLRTQATSVNSDF